jgi:hypothetical protein
MRSRSHGDKKACAKLANTHERATVVESASFRTDKASYRKLQGLREDSGEPCHQFIVPDLFVA